MRIFLLLTSAALLTVSTAAAAQNPVVLEVHNKWNSAAPPPSAEVTTNQVMKAAKEAQKKLGGCLPTSAVVEGISPATGVRFIVEGILARRIKNGWTVVARHPNCDNGPVRYTMSQDSSGGFSTIRTNRGQSLANESLIGDTYSRAIFLADVVLTRAKIKCDILSAIMGVTRVDKEEPGLGPDVFGVRYKGSWSEIWPIILCGRTVEVNVRFTADGDGGAYTGIKEENAKLLPAAG